MNKSLNFMGDINAFKNYLFFIFKLFLISLIISLLVYLIHYYIFYKLMDDYRSPWVIIFGISLVILISTRLVFKSNLFIGSYIYRGIILLLSCLFSICAVVFFIAMFFTLTFGS
jgi:hypothetical protein